MKLLKLTTCAAVAALGLSATSANALTINLINTGGVEPGTAAYIGFSAAAKYWESVITDNVTLNFRVGFTSVGFAPTTLGQTSSASSNVAQSVWRTGITADSKTSLDAIAVANLATFSSSTVNLNTSVQKAIGINNTTAIDATITFNSARPFDFDTRDGFDASNPASDFVSVAVHEMGHALGFTSAVSQNTTTNSRPSNTDMFRYKSGAWNNTWGGYAYFSIDGGATELFGNAGFSSGPDGFQTSHWREGSRIHDGVSCTILTEAQVGIMDPTGGLCQEGIVTAQDLALFDAIGWDINVDVLSNASYQMKTSDIMRAYLATTSVPEPATWAMLIVGFGFVGGAMRRRNVSVTFA